MRKLIVVALSIFAQADFAAAGAPCSQSDLTGKWDFYVLTVKQPSTTRCALAINDAGTATGRCTDQDGVNHTVSQGSIKMKTPAVCAFTGHFNVGATTYNLRRGTMAQDANTAAGAGELPGDIFAFNAVKAP